MRELCARLEHLTATNQIPRYQCCQGERQGETTGLFPAPEYQWNCAAVSFDFDFDFDFVHDFDRVRVPPLRDPDVWVDLKDAYELGPAFDHVLLRAALAAHAHHTLRAWRNLRGPRDALSKLRAREARGAKARGAKARGAKPREGEAPVDAPDPSVLLFQTARGLEVSYLAPGKASVLDRFLIPDSKSEHSASEHSAKSPDSPADSDAIFAEIIARAPPGP